MSLKEALAGPLAGMAAYPQFVLYRLQPSKSRPGKTDKIPVSYATGQASNAHDPANWTDAFTAETMAAVWGEGYGVGFVFTKNDPFHFLDIDSCLIDGQWSPLALSLCGQLQGAAVEVSNSLKGLHIFFTGSIGPHSCRNQAHGLELYSEGRFVALTGLGAVGDCRTDASAALPALVASYFPAETGEAREIGEGPVPEWNGPTDDSELLRRAMRPTANSEFGTKASFADLWEANEAKLAVSYPDAGGRSYDASSADAALAQHLAFWTGCDADRMQRLMLQSGLVRDKYEREDYLPRTIMGAIGRQEEVCKDKPRAELVDPADGVSASPVRTGEPILNPEQQREYFAGCIYVRSGHCVLAPDGTFMKPEVFKVKYGGKVFVLDSINQKTTRDAWEALTQSQVNECPIVFDTCFKPKLPFGEIVTIDSQVFANTYYPVEIESRPGDPSRFLNHMAKLLPIQSDREILLSYMAAIVQHQGTKFQWAPLIQGAEGNGKTLLSRCIDRAVGSRYTEWPSGETLVNKFNQWICNKIFVAVEDVHISESKTYLLDVLKPMITNSEITIEGKGVNHKRAEICANFMFNTNHKDALRKTEDERRICPLFTAQQSKADIERDGMGGDYFDSLYKWLRAEGYAIVTDYLRNYQIPYALNPTGGCSRAPKSSSHEDAISASKGTIEQEISEAIEQGIQGFSGNWISSIMLGRFLEDRGLDKRAPLNKRRQILQQMGYVSHPALPGGRVNNTVTPDNGKPRLFVKVGSLAEQISNPIEAVKNYEMTNRIISGLPFAARG